MKTLLRKFFCKVNLHFVALSCCGIFGLFESLRAQEIPEGFYPVRPSGMGGAFTAVANSEDAIWTNPAGISRIKKARSRNSVHLASFPAITAGYNGEGDTFIKSVRDGEKALVSGADKIQNKPFWALASMAPVMIMEMAQSTTAVGAFSVIQTNAVVDDDNPSQARASIVMDTGGVVSFTKSNKSNRFNVGIQARYVARGAYEEYLPLATLDDREQMKKNFMDNSNKSVGLGVDAGFMWTLADFWFPTIGVSVLNIPVSGCKKDYLNPFSKKRETVCGTVFRGTINNPDALSVLDPTDIRFGISISPRITQKIGMRIALDQHHFHTLSGEQHFGYSEIPLLKTVHAGVELYTGNPLLQSPASVSMGYSQGYYTMGANLQLGILSLGFARFGRDVSNDVTPKEDIRYIGSFSLRM
jgi:hypothetical protein